MKSKIPADVLGMYFGREAQDDESATPRSAPILEPGGQRMSRGADNKSSG